MAVLKHRSRYRSLTISLLASQLRSSLADTSGRGARCCATLNLPHRAAIRASFTVLQAEMGVWRVLSRWVVLRLSMYFKYARPAACGGLAPLSVWRPSARTRGDECLRHGIDVHVCHPQVPDAVRGGQPGNMSTGGWGRGQTFRRKLANILNLRDERSASCADATASHDAARWGCCCYCCPRWFRGDARMLHAPTCTVQPCWHGVRCAGSVPCALFWAAVGGSA